MCTEQVSGRDSGCRVDVIKHSSLMVGCERFSRSKENGKFCESGVDMLKSSGNFVWLKSSDH